MFRKNGSFKKLIVNLCKLTSGRNAPHADRRRKPYPQTEGTLLPAVCLQNNLREVLTLKSINLKICDIYGAENSEDIKEGAGMLGGNKKHYNR